VSSRAISWLCGFLGAILPGFSHGMTNAFFKDVPAIAPLVREYRSGLSLRVYLPPDIRPGAKRPAILFVHGGGWGAGKPELVEPHCRYYAAKGIVAAAVQYRLTSATTTVFDCIADVKASVRWLRDHAAELNVDPDRIAAFGDSAGGHLAACAGLMAGLEAEGESLAISSRPNALVLLYPITDTTPPDGWDVVRYGGKAGASVAGRLRELSPADNITTGAPPTLVLHGTADTVVPFSQSERFADAMRGKGNVCDWVPIEGAGHAFITPGYGDDAVIRRALARVDLFLEKLGYLVERSK
jgi:acetyl esterase